MTTITWKSTVGGAWSDSADWSPARVPGSGDLANFDTGGNSYTVAGDASVFYIDVDGDNPTFTGHVQVGNDVDVNNNGGVTIASTAVLSAGGLFFSKGSLLQVQGTVIDTASGGQADVINVGGLDANLTTSAPITLNQLYVNGGGSYAGDVKLNAGGSVVLDTSATFGGGQLALNGDGTLYLALATGAPAGTTLGVNENIRTSSVAGDGLVLASDPGATLEVTGRIDGSFVFIDSGSVILDAANSYRVGTVVDHASLTLIGAAAAGTGPIFMGDASLTTQADGTGAVQQTVVAGLDSDTINATAGALLVFDGAAGFSFTGGAGASTVVGSAYAMTATAGSGGGLMFGSSSGQDVLTTGSGATTLVGGLGGRLYAVGAAANTLVASGGNTTLNGANSTGNNIFFTNGTGNTEVAAGSGTSTVVAGGAHNTILASAGTQDVFLNAGVSQFNFVSGFAGGIENIIGFTSADTLHLVDYGAGEAQSALAGSSVEGTSTVITLSDNTKIVLFGYTGVTAATFV